MATEAEEQMLWFDIWERKKELIIVTRISFGQE